MRSHGLRGAELTARLGALESVQLLAPGHDAIDCRNIGDLDLEHAGDRDNARETVSAMVTLSP